MDLQPVIRAQFCRQFVNREIWPGRDPPRHPILHARELATSRIALRFRRKRAGLALKPHHVVDELDRNTKTPRRLGVRVPRINKPHSTFAQFNRMRLSHL